MEPRDDAPKVGDYLGLCQFGEINAPCAYRYFDQPRYADAMDRGNLLISSLESWRNAEGVRRDIRAGARWRRELNCCHVSLPAAY